MPTMPLAESPPSPVLRPPRAALVLGVDPGLLRTGYALLSDAPAPREVYLLEAGTVRLARGAPLAERLVELEQGLMMLIERHRPDTLACEELYAHYKHPRTAILMAHARGVILALAARMGLRIVSVAATNVKKLLTGSGRAKKRQVQLAVMATLRLPVLPEPHDVADAIAIALCGLRLRQGEMKAVAAGRAAHASRIRTRSVKRRPGTPPRGGNPDNSGQSARSGERGESTRPTGGSERSGQARRAQA